MKRLFIGLLILVCSAVLLPDVNQYYLMLGNMMRKPVSDQALLTTSSPTFVGLTLTGLTASRALTTNGSKVLTSSATTDTELGYVSGVTSAIQTQLGTMVKIDGTTGKTASILSLTDGATQAITAEQCRSYFIHNGACTQNIEIDMPAATVGMAVVVYVKAAFTIKIDPNLTDQIMVITSAAGDYLVSDAVVGTFISLVCFENGKWYMTGMNGAWTEE